jgi:hypothetical protein
MIGGVLCAAAAAAAAAVRPLSAASRLPRSSSLFHAPRYVGAHHKYFCFKKILRRRDFSRSCCPLLHVGTAVGRGAPDVVTAQPLKVLSSLRPPVTVFCPELLLSIFGQFAIHITAMVYAVSLCEPYFDMCARAGARAGRGGGGDAGGAASATCSCVKCARSRRAQ